MQVDYSTTSYNVVRISLYNYTNTHCIQHSDVNKDLRYKAKAKDLKKLTLKAKDQSFKAKAKDIELI